jgi:cytochrome c peroxidase
VKREPIRPIPLEVQVDWKKAALGKRLFQDVRLSHDNTLSCASCHDLAKGGVDGRKHSLGIQGAEGELNAPTVFNSGANFKQFWDGRVVTLEEQVDGPVQAKAEMGSTWPEILGKLQADAGYVAAFREVFANGLQVENVRSAIAEFERTLITPNSRFDKYLRGDETALSSEEKEGYQKFKAYGCASCHQGVNVGGNLFATLGAMYDYFGERDEVTKVDYGRFNVTKNEEDRFAFKVPSLRNVARTAPYFHDGSAKTLERAVIVMGRYQLGERIPAEDVQKIVRFLETLTGEYEGKPL